MLSVLSASIFSLSLSLCPVSFGPCCAPRHPTAGAGIDCVARILSGHRRVFLCSIAAGGRLGRKAGESKRAARGVPARPPADLPACPVVAGSDHLAPRLPCTQACWNILAVS